MCPCSYNDMSSRSRSRTQLSGGRRSRSLGLDLSEVPKHVRRNNSRRRTSATSGRSVYSELSDNVHQVAPSWDEKTEEEPETSKVGGIFSCYHSNVSVPLFNDIFSAIADC